MDENNYTTEVAATRPERLRWFQDARFGMFVHWGLYSQLGRHEWAMNRERIPLAEYEPLADSWHPRPRAAREWAALAAEAGMKYMVMTTKHHEGFCLWDTQMTDYNAVRHGPGRDLVREYVDACREFGLKVGFYYSLMDWHHPDGARCAVDEDARQRFVEFTDGCVRELMTNYGPIDILWYDVCWPLTSAALWESPRRNAMVRALQPQILINNRSWLAEDFGTPEEHVTPAETGRAWEACLTFNGSWGYMPSAIDWLSARDVVKHLRTAAAGQGNLLLNIGPLPDGSVPEQALPRLKAVGAWLRQNGEAVYGPVERIDGRLEGMPIGHFTLKGSTAYFWAERWPGGELAIGGLHNQVVRATYLSTGEEIAFENDHNRLLLKGLPAENPDLHVGITVIKLECAAPPSNPL
ncbi:MAG: alpha-L-fucosidase, partial [Anaerolineales bacterium]